MPCFHLLRNIFPLAGFKGNLSLKGIYHYWKYVVLFFPVSRELKQMEAFGRILREVAPNLLRCRHAGPHARTHAHDACAQTYRHLCDPLRHERP